MIMENDRLMLRRLEDKDLNGLIRLRDDLCVYRYEPAFLIELQGTPAEALKIIQETDLWKDRQCILGIFEKNNPDILTGFAEFYDFKPSGKVISIGYRLMSEYWGHDHPDVADVYTFDC